LRDGRLVIWRTLLAGQRSAGIPAIYCEGEHLFARCVDGATLRLLSADLNGVALSASVFRSRFGSAELALLV
jgi:hypothetical protein